MAMEVTLEQGTEEDYKQNNLRIAIFARITERLAATHHEIVYISSMNPGDSGFVKFIVHEKGQSGRPCMSINAQASGDDALGIVSLFAIVEGVGGERNLHHISSPDDITDQLLSQMIKEELGRLHEGGRSR